MNDSEFEKHIQRQPLRPIPTEWRSEILRSAGVAATRPSMASLPWLGILKLWCELIWPARRIWSGFALVWVVIIAVNLADTEKSGNLGGDLKVPPGNLIAVWERQQRLLTELNSPENPEMDKPRQNVPQPRSERPSRDATV